MTEAHFLQSLVTVRQALQAFPESTYTSADGQVTVLANAWITDLQLDQQAGSLVFHTHSSPTAEVHVTLRLTMDLLGEAPTITTDGVPVTAEFSSDGTARRAEFILTGGPHSVQVLKP